MKACLILDSKFPTQKAYGVTTINTMRELTKLELSPVLICASPREGFQNYTSLDFKITYYPINRLTKALDKISAKSFGWKSKIAWNFVQMHNSIAIRKQVTRMSPDIIWTREQPVPRYISKKLNGVHVIEIHKDLNWRRTRRIRKLGLERVVLCPISASLKRKVEARFPNARIVLAPMGVTAADISKEQLRSEIRNHYLQKKSIIRIGYFGKLSPSGISKGYEDLLELGAVLKERNVVFKIIFVGIDKNEIKILTNAMQAKDLDLDDVEVITHQIHSVALQMMKECDFLILPENRDPNYFGFPLKALEYLMSGRVVLASRTPVNTDLFMGTFQPYWYEPELIQNLADKIQRIRTDLDLIEYLVSGADYANGYSWKSRTKNIANSASEVLKSIRLS